MFANFVLGCLLIGAFKGQPVENKCCQSKTVGNVNYVLVSEGEVPTMCKSNCIYQMKDDPTSRYCFAPGDLPVVCGDISNAENIGTLGTEIPLSAGAKIGWRKVENQEKPIFGTLGAFLEKGSGGQTYILTNAHVVDYELGKDVYFYYEEEEKWFGKLIGTVKQTTHRDYREELDAAVVTIQNPADWIIDYSYFGKKLTGSANAEDGQKVFTLGATAGRIASNVVDDDATFEYQNKKIRHQLKLGYGSGPINRGGDSGSVVVSVKDWKVVGLYWATESFFGYANQIIRVLNQEDWGYSIKTEM